MWNLRITSEQFKDFYDIEPPEIFSREPDNEDDLWANFMPSKLWRLNNLYTITDKYGEEVRFIMNYAQHKVYGATVKHPRIIVLKSRQQGISTFWLVSFFDDALVEDNYECGLMTIGQKESKALFRRVKRLWERLPQFVKDYLRLDLVRDTKEELGFANGAVMYLQSSFRSGTLQRLHISELGKIAAKYPEKAEETKTGSLQAIKVGNTVVIESTAMGRKNAFYYMWYMAKDYVGVKSGKDFMAVFLSWAEDPDCSIDIPQHINKEAAEYFTKCEALGLTDMHNRPVNIVLSDEQKWWWISQKRELGDKMSQEYPFNDDEAFEAVRDGAYYAVLFRDEVEKRGRVITNSKERATNSNGKLVYVEYGSMDVAKAKLSPMYEPTVLVEVAFDLGMNDSMELVFFQRFGRDKRIIDYYYSSGEGLEHYVNVMKDKPYNYGSVWLPHDAKVRELGTGLSRLARLRELGVKGRVLKRSDVNTGIEQVRKMLPSLWIDGDRCSRLVTMFFSYSKAWDDTNGVFKDKPLHDEWSNPADAIRYMAMSKGSGRDEGYGSQDKTTTIRSNSSKHSKHSNVVDGMAM